MREQLTLLEAAVMEEVVFNCERENVELSENAALAIAMEVVHNSDMVWKMMNEHICQLIHERK